MHTDGFALKSPRIADAYVELASYARHGRRCVLLGPSGAGKEHAALYFYQRYAEQMHGTPPFRSVNCGALSAGTAASELFGHVKGAFTGAVQDHTGLFRSAAGGVLFLDEIGDLPTDVVPSLLRALDERHGKARAVGSEKEYDTTGVIVIAATERPAEAMRPALLARLAKQVVIPGLEERAEDLAPAMAFFCARAVAKCRDGQELDARLCKLAKSEPPVTDMRETSTPKLPAWAETLARPLVPLAAKRTWPGNFRALATAVDAAIVCAERGRDAVAFLHSVTRQFECHAPRYSAPHAGPMVASSTFMASCLTRVEPEEEGRLYEHLIGVLPVTAGRDRKAAALSRFLQTRVGKPFMRRDAASAMPGISDRTLLDYLGITERAGLVSRSGGKRQYYHYPPERVAMAGALDFLCSGRFVLPRTEDLDTETAARVHELCAIFKQTHKLFLASADAEKRTACAVRVAGQAGTSGSYLSIESVDSLEQFISLVEQTVMAANGLDISDATIRTLPQRILGSAGFLFHHCQGAAHTLIIDRTDALTTGEQQQILAHLIDAWPWFSFILCGTKMGTELARLCTEHRI